MNAPPSQNKASETESPLDLSAYLNPESEPSVTPEISTDSGALAGQSNLPVEVQIPMAPMERLVDLSSLLPEQRAVAQKLAESIRFDDATSTLNFVDNALQPLALASRRLLADTTVGETGEIGRIAAAVIDGIKILRIEELQEEAREAAPKVTGFLSKLIHLGTVAHGAAKSFHENRKAFLGLMDAEEARARRTKADLMITIQQLDEQSKAVRQGVSDLSIGIAAMQMALERGVGEAEQLRLVALRTNTAGDAAIAMDYRNTLGNFRGRIADLREAMISAATLIPLIASNRKSAETRVSKLTTGIMVTIPRLMAVAAQAVVQADTRRAGEESEKLDEAARRITALAVQGAHDAALDAAHSLGGDPRNLEALAAAATQSIETMKEVLVIEQQVLAQDREREQKLIEVRNKLVEGMRGVRAQALAAPSGA
ncbi:toxic anion resistance protein [Caballeronia sp. ATUFL_M2_KS44]|uniref:toxic anion resistance protein n=1 Tax=Caballeronia sp. ATUFL_M2_KS44 TaxID=2921767 RepID=UPI002029916D|nr:toxic anion resistance protein [Caballeronia sp. ATUFL_M2_KS44]